MGRYVPVELVKFWDDIVTQDLRAISSHHRQWEENWDVVANTGSGFLRGNLVSEFTADITKRLLTKQLTVNVTTDDPINSSFAKDYEIIAQSVARIAGLQQEFKDVCADVIATNSGWLEVGHPMDPYNLDVELSMTAPRVKPSFSYEDEFVPVPPRLAEAIFSGQTEAEIDPFAPMEESRINNERGPTPIIGSTDFGYPYVKRVDPRYIVFPPKSRNVSGMDYIVRLRFVTRQELLALRGNLEIPENISAASEYMDILTKVEGRDRVFYTNMVCVIEMYLKRDRNNPQFNNWFLRWVAGYPSIVLDDTPNPNGALVPLFRVDFELSKPVLGTSKAREMYDFAIIFDLALQSMRKDVKRNLNRKTIVGPNAFADDAQRKNYNNDNFEGVVTVNDPNAISTAEFKMNRDLFNLMTFFRSTAQAASDVSDLDRGTAIKSITARQTEALLTATGREIESIKARIEKVCSDIVQALMFILSRFGMKDDGTKFKLGKDVVSLDRIRGSFITSYLYAVTVFDSGDAQTSEQMLLFNQLIKTLNTPVGQTMLQGIDINQLTRSMLRVFGLGYDLLNNENSAGTQVQPTDQLSALQPNSPVLQQVQGQHPERENGDRGISLQNATSGLQKIGT